MSDTENQESETRVRRRAATERSLDQAARDLEALNTKVDSLTQENASLKTDVERLQGELDSAQVKLKAALDEAERIQNERALAELASKRSEQVANLGLFSKEYIEEKASKWASIDDVEWAERLEEWQNLKPSAAVAQDSDSASAMSGSSEVLTTEATRKTSALRSALGLD